MERTAAVIGGGIVGLAVARQVAVACPGTRVVLLEKEGDLAQHQTGRNSGVIHSGIYYKPGSLKARTCTHGRRLLLEFCQEHRVTHEVCGKVIVATSQEEVPQLRMLEERGKANGVRATWLSAEALREREPAAAGVAALQVDDTGIADYVGMCHALAACIRAAGGQVRVNARVDALQRVGGVGAGAGAGGAAGAGSAAGAGHAAGSGAVELAGPWGQLRADVVFNCAGLHCDRVAQAARSPARASCRSAASTTACAPTRRRCAGI
ncbi:MAG: FAD-dependent oxidoreductase [Phycisphaerales bacterium]